IATSAQGLLVSARHLQLVDVAALMEAAADLLSGHWKPRPKVGRAAAAVYLSLLTGRSIQHLNKFRVFATPAEADPAGAQDVELIVDTRQFRIRIPELPNAYVPAAEEAYLYRATTRTLNLKLPVLPCTSLILRVLKSIAQVPFGKRNPTLVKQAEDFVRMVNHRAGARITLARVAQFLARQIHLMSGDWADVSLVSGEERSDPRLYYYAPSVVTLQNHYDAVWRGVQAGLRPPDSESSSAPVSNGANASRGPSVSVGSRGCPRDDAVREMVESQIESCQAALRGRRGSKRIRTAHNALAIYTYLMVAWHTGVRAVDVPVDLVQYDSATGFLGVSDKDTDDYYASRLAWLPPVAQKQVARYLSNVDTLSADAGLELAHGLGLFLLDDAGKPVQFTMKVLRRLLVDYPFRLNAQRHYLRTRLRELHVPAQAVDALLGHGDPGQESYARHSCYSPEQMKREMGSALKKLSIQMGWRVLPAC
ncbi:MAG: hypothetical protein L0H29_07080, partial [Sinobacteraceae bacterium]|nr:hypothetical protein [Nevskiaceae bacterium]